MQTEQHRRLPPNNLVTRESSLHSATEDLRRELDQLISGFDLASAVDYRRFLLASAAAQLALETLLEGSGVEAMMSDWPARARRSAILADLKRLDAQAHPMELRRKAPNSAEIFGMLFVLEAWRRSAPALLESVLDSQDAQVREARAYLSAHDPALWSSLIEVLENDPTTADQSQTVAGAIYAYTILIRSFEHAPA